MWYILDADDNPQPTWLVRKHPITGETEVNHPFNEWMYGKPGGDDNNRRVAITTIPGVSEVSTVFLGLDHSFGTGPPILFETMIFCNNTDDDLHNWQHRYNTKAQAILGHAIIVRLAKGDITDDDATLLLAKPRDSHG